MTSAAPELFGDLLKYLRRRARLTQRELAQAVGYTEAHISRLENNQRLPDLSMLAALFAPALDLEDQPETMSQLLQLAAQARGEQPVQRLNVDQLTLQQQVDEEIGALEDVPPPPPYRVDRSVIVARLRELLALEKHVAISGLPGMGKTMIAAALAHEWPDPREVFWLTLTPGVTTSIATIVRQLALFLLARGHTQLRVLAQRRAEAGRLLPLDQQFELISSALSQQPALLCFDDVHLVRDDEMITALLRHLIAVTPVSVLLLSREDVPLANVAQVRMIGLEKDEARDLMEQLGLHLKEAWADRLFAKTGGNPMLLRLAAGQLRDRQTTPLEFIEHLETQPQVAQYLLTVVLRDLSDAARWLSALVAVFRQPIDVYDSALIDLIDQAEGPRDLDRAAAELQRRQLIDQPRRAQLHPLIRDNIYATLAADAVRKKQLHRVAAEYSETVLNDIVEAAYHFGRAGDLAEAVEVMADQSDRLYNRGQAAAAAVVADELLLLLRRKRGDTTDLLRRLLTARGDLLRSTLRADEAEASYREALSLAQNSSTARAEIARLLAQFLMQRGHSEVSLQLARSAAAELPEADVILRARLGVVESRALVVLSHYQEAEQVARRVLQLTEQFAEYAPQVADDVRARCERTLGWIIYTRAPEDPEVMLHYQRSLEACRRIDLRVIENALLSNIGVALMDQGDYDGSLKMYQASLEGSEALGDLYSSAATSHNMALLLYMHGDYDAALSQLDRACEMEKQVGDWNGLLSSENARGDMLEIMGRIDEARVVLEQALAAARDQNDVWTYGSCLATLVEVQILQGDFAAAQQTAQRLLAMPGVPDNARIYSAAQCSLAFAHLMSGDRVEARRIMEQMLVERLEFEVGLKRQLYEAIVGLAYGTLETSRSILLSVKQRAQATNYVPYLHAVDRLLKAIDRNAPLSEMPRLLYCDVGEGQGAGGKMQDASGKLQVEDTVAS
jgi:ATP/maltotriose-dependent transcriptional regulator MalT/DNA-binding XRE family transcriptional regulator